MPWHQSQSIGSTNDFGGFFIDFSAKGGKRNGENNDECTGTGITDGNQPAKSIQTGQVTRFSRNPHREKNPDSSGGIQRMAAQNIRKPVNENFNITERRERK